MAAPPGIEKSPTLFNKSNEADALYSRCVIPGSPVEIIKPDEPKSLSQTTTRLFYSRFHCVSNGFKLKTPFCALWYPANVAENEGWKKFIKWLPASLATTLNPNANTPAFEPFRQLKSLKVKGKTSAVNVPRVISRAVKKLPKFWRNNRGIVCLLQRTLVSKLFSGKRVFELPRHSSSSRRFLFSPAIFLNLHHVAVSPSRFSCTLCLPPLTSVWSLSSGAPWKPRTSWQKCTSTHTRPNSLQ